MDNLGRQHLPAGTSGRALRRLPNRRLLDRECLSLTPVTSGGADEQTDPDPVGEYAQSVLGRDRLLQHMSITNGTPVAILRLNYANDLDIGRPWVRTTTGPAPQVSM